MQHVPNPEAEASYLTSVAVFPLAPNLHRFRFRWLCVPNPEADYPGRHSKLLSSAAMSPVVMSPLAPRCRMCSMSIGRGPSMEESLEFMNNWKDAAKERGFKLKLSGHR